MIHQNLRRCGWAWTSEYVLKVICEKGILVDKENYIAVAWIEGNKLITHGIGPLIQRDGTDVSAINNPWYFEWREPLPENKGQSIAEAIRGNTAIALTDGSFLRNGSAGFCIGDSLKSVWQGAC